MSLEMDSDVPSRNPLSYCHLCLSQVNLLTVLGSSSEANQPPMKEVLQKLHHYTKVVLLAQDFPCAICGVCKAQVNDFHEFRRNVVRNHNAVKIFRKTFGDEIEYVEPEAEEEMYVEIIEDSQQLADIIQEEYGDTMELKEVDVYHVNGELRTVVVKPDQDAPASKQLINRVSPKKIPPALPVNILNKSGSQTTPLPTIQNPQKRVVKTSTSGAVLTVYKCSPCRAVFQSQENLTIHQQNDHPYLLKTSSQPAEASQRLAVHKVEPRKQPPPPPTSPPKKRPLSKPSVSPQTQKLLFKCTSCASSFVQEQNLKQHQITCKPAALLNKLNLSQITIKRTKVQDPQPRPVATERIQCEHCKLTYKTRHYLNKHLIEVHKVMPKQQPPMHFCSLCSLSYSCLQDLQLHNRALHPFRCSTCAADYRKCLHKQLAVTQQESVENGAGGGGANKAMKAA